jgi:caa(3)-type oxidase subunit IV
MNAPTSSNHTAVFISLIVLVLCAVGVTFLHLSVMTQNFSIFGVAAVMASLVFFQYMNLKSEGHLIYWLTIIPLVLFAILVVLLMPDVCHYSIPFLKGLF